MVSKLSNMKKRDPKKQLKLQKIATKRALYEKARRLRIKKTGIGGKSEINTQNSQTE